MEPIKKFATLLLLLLFTVLLSCSKNDDLVQENPVQEETPKFVNTETISALDGEEIKLNTNITVNVEKYDLFIGNSKQEYTTESSPAAIIFNAKYKAEESKELLIVLKDKSGKTVATGGKIIIQEVYRCYQIVNVTSISRFLTSFILNNDNSFFGLNPTAMTSENITIYQYDFLGINDNIWGNSYGINSFSTNAIKILPPDMNSLIQLTPGSDNSTNRFMCMGFAKSGNKFYFPRLFRPSSGTGIYCLLHVYDGESCYLYKHNSDTIFFNSLPNDIVADSKGNLFIYCSKSPAVYKLDETNGLQLFAGSETESGYKDAKGKDARFGTPEGDGVRNMLIDANDNLYVAEKTKIRKISPDGTVSTLIGTNESTDVVGSMNEARFVDIKSFAMTKKNVIYLIEENTDYLKIIDIGKQSVKKMKVAGPVGNFQHFNTSNQYRMAVNEQGVIFMERRVNDLNSSVTVICPTDQLKK